VKKRLKPNIIGIVGAIISFVSLAVPWWTTTMSVNPSVMGFSRSVSIYPYQASVSSGGASTTVQLNTWYGWVAFALIVVGGLLGLAGSLMRGARVILAAGGVLALFSIVVFAAGLQDDLSNKTVVPGWPAVGLFSIGNLGGSSYTAYLSFGFWLALVGAIVMVAASLRKPQAGGVSPATPAPAPPTPPPAPPTSGLARAFQP
jgi:predicted lysophospholipase L1 biosynthesis ABC-type transport system permease subunit